MRIFILVLAVFVTLVSCDKLDELTKFDLEYKSQVTIPSTAGVDLPFDMFTPDMETNSDSQFEVNDTRKDLIEEIKLTRLQLVITSPDDSDFSFLESLVVYISAEGLDEIKIASKEVVDENVGDVLDVDVLDVDLKEYIKKDKFNLRLKTVTDELISTDHEIDVNSTFFVDAKILGL
ncbi:hypothetical protein Q4603_07480 [Zobellia galactanivorans]|uniref:Membrane lipoprotein n=1 Tax=Zobellia galactanivorans (strain DSM 12802 / CCUG 47099 / CIP 106680 / NCIMB 13871 / Dsij) TaxID=63186 RepID=G0L3C7_ZOBGA|nr:MULTISPECIES: hypothetical protein [Zobellia]MBU3028163.1 hypothetical protein [Zobellia galactanivorans]MDO6808444.1 hypothetical protein [Zobellia galactanivorans]OWW26420.1 hypothetical protein B4Q04_01685 [Zobellia sp. OII3]CAZ95358.1 Conserved hypothetical protein [Zobellia galactanivorans]